MKKIKSLAAVFLALFILAAIPTQAFAAETHEGVATMHTHQWRLDHYDTTYIPIDDETHLKTVYRDLPTVRLVGYRRLSLPSEYRLCP